MFKSVKAGLLLLAVMLQPASLQAELRDPTRPPGLEMSLDAASLQTPQDALKLQAIFFSNQRPSALISGQRVAVGDVVGAARVTRISPDRVTLEGREGEVLLKLPLPSVKTRAMPVGGNTQ